MHQPGKPIGFWSALSLGMGAMMQEVILSDVRSDRFYQQYARQGQEQTGQLACN